MIDAETRVACVLGRPAKHSLSPAMHNAAFSRLGLNIVYLAFEPRDISGAVAALRELDAVGFNVTMPFKSPVMKELDKVDGTAEKIGAVNTVVNSGGKLVGYNTDGLGAIRALKRRVKVRGKRVLLVGAGGAGRAIAFALAQEKAGVFVADRNSGRARELCRRTGARHVELESLRTLGGFDILVNATPAGMRPNVRDTPVPARLLHRKMVVFDIVYDPLETRLLKEAGKRGCRRISGIEMLLEQGCEAFRLFTGRKAPRSAMRKALMERLKGRK